MDINSQPYAIEMRNITKRFPGIIANDNITLGLKKGEIHALLGENGAGKSTLMSVLFGLYQPEEGEILKDGVPVKLTIEVNDTGLVASDKNGKPNPTTGRIGADEYLYDHPSIVVQ